MNKSVRLPVTKFHVDRIFEIVRDTGTRGNFPDLPFGGAPPAYRGRHSKGLLEEDASTNKQEHMFVYDNSFVVSE